MKKPPNKAAIERAPSEDLASSSTPDTAIQDVSTGPVPTKAPRKPAAAKKVPGFKGSRVSKGSKVSKVQARGAGKLGASERPLRILMVTSEAHPFAKTGGLAEVAAALPAALARLGHSVTVVLPRYQGVSPGAVPPERIDLPLGSSGVSVGFIDQPLTDGVKAVLVDVPELFDRPGLYGVDGRDFPDNARRFAVLSRAALEYARLQGQPLDVIHAHDWQAGLVPVYQKMQLADDPIVGRATVVFTIHNLAFQGVFPRQALEAAGLGWNVFTPDAVEYWGNVSFLKGGVNFSERITTVSPRYAREILTPEFGFGFEGVLRQRSADVLGILNGIDTDRWNPATDPFTARYSAKNLTGKREAKAALLRELGLPLDEAALARPVVGLISRLTYQKGFDLIEEAAPTLMALNATWAMLGSGEPRYEHMWRVLAAHHPDRVSATIGFNERLAHMIEAGADMFLMPSRFEPCGLNQLYSLRYGTVPVVRATGGLDDTVIDAAEPGGNGIKFSAAAPGALITAVRRALELFEDRGKWEKLQQAGMATDPSWDVSAGEYVKVYRGGRGNHGI